MATKEYYLIKTNYSHYYVEIFHQYPTVDKVYIGGKQWCVTFSIYLDGDLPNIDGIGYDKDCNVTLNLVKSIGTKHMFLCSLAFIKHIYKNTISSTFILRDTSKIDCNKYKMFLPHYYILHHGQTWYQKQFGAEPLDNTNLRDDLEAFKNHLKTKPPSNILFKSVIGKERRKYLEDIYDKHSSIKSFLKETKKLDCSIYKDWGSDLVNKFLPYLIGMEWKIDTKPLEKPDISIEFLGNNKPKDLVIRGGNIINTISSPKYLYK